MPQKLQRNNRDALHRSIDLKWERDQTEKSIYGLDWLQKDIWYGSTKLDNKPPQNVQNFSQIFLEKTMKTWRVGLIAGGRSLAEAKIQRGICQGDTLLPLLFVIALMTLNHILRKGIAGYKLSRSQGQTPNVYHHHHIVLAARISLTLSRHSSLSFIALGRSSGQQPVSSHSCWMYVRAGRPAFARPCVGIHKSTSLMSSSLLLQQCPACLKMKKNRKI